jgi:DNA-binding transcriptional LysR family regulator
LPRRTRRRAEAAERRPPRQPAAGKQSAAPASGTWTASADDATPKITDPALKQGVQEIEFLSNPETGELLIGSGSAFAEGFVLAVIDRLSQRYPRVAYHLMPGTLLALYGQLRERRIELAFSGNSEFDLQEDMDAEVLFEEPLVVAASAENPWVRRRRVHLADLVDEPWTWSPPGSVVDRLVVEAFLANGLDPPGAAVYTDAINVRIRLAATRGFLTVVPASQA